MLLYTETQRLPRGGQLILAMALLCVVAPVFFLPEQAEAEGKKVFVSYFLGVLVLSFMIVFTSLKTELKRDTLHVRLYFPLPLFGRRLPLKQLISVEVVTFRPFRDAMGWGFHYGRFRGRCCRYFNMGGTGGVYLYDDQNRQFIIGSQDPEALAEVIEKARTELLLRSARAENFMS